MGAIIMRIDFATLAFGYRVKSGGNTPNWATALGQGNGYRINNNPEINEILKGMVYSSASLEKITTKIGKGGKVVAGNEPNSPIVIAAVFSKVYVNDVLINDGKFVLLITRDTSESHAGRLRLKYGPGNAYFDYSNQNFFHQVTKQLNLADDACWFVSDISIRNQNELILRTIVVNPEGPVEYENSADLHRAWNTLEVQKFGAIDSREEVINGTNILLYGVPGSGKSWTIEHEYCKKGTNVERLVFHPDYTYSDFVGQILPNVAENGQVSYEFTPGPFTNILAEAYAHPYEEYVLIIEEINRGNAPAIFGEIFQLLDRKTETREDDNGFPVGTSEYAITNTNIAKIVYGDPNHKVRIPANLSIIGTMNTSDQNVFTLDTAFQRRWQMRLIENDFETVDRKLADAEILDTGITWEVFCTEINEIIVGNNVRMTSSEDKRLGAYFVGLLDLQMDSKMGSLSDGKYDDLRKKESAGVITPEGEKRLAEIRKAMKQNRRFPEKVIKYLWDDAFKFNREVIFETTEYRSLESVIRAFMYAEGIQRFKMFKQNVVDALQNPDSE